MIPQDAKCEMLFNSKPIDEFTDDELVKLLEWQSRVWAKAGMTPLNVGHDIFRLDVQIMTITEILIESGTITENEFNHIFKRKMLEKLYNIYQQHHKDVLKARLTQGIIGPNGMPIDV